MNYQRNIWKMDNILIDTDVVLDLLLDREPFSEYAVTIFTFCEEHRIKGFVTPVIISNVYFILRRFSTHEKVIETLSRLLMIIDVLPMDKKVVLAALSSGFKDFEDALQNFSATNWGEIKTILTRNVKDYRKSELVIMTPESYIKLKFQK